MGIYMIHIWDLSPILDIYNNINGNHYLGFSHHGFGMIHIWDLSLILFPFSVFTITLMVIIT